MLDSRPVIYITITRNGRILFEIKKKMFGLEKIPLKEQCDFKPTESYDKQLQQSKWGIILRNQLNSQLKMQQEVLQMAKAQNWPLRRCKRT